MKRTLTIILTVYAMMMATDMMGQALLRTHVETGDVEGVLEDGLALYKAIPYAAPPVGNLRWREPQPAQPWMGVLKSDKYGPLPPQPTRPGRTADMMSEDCLYLGIATPAQTVRDSLPVMVWIHGGSFRTEHYGGDLRGCLTGRRSTTPVPPPCSSPMVPRSSCVPTASRWTSSTATTKPSARRLRHIDETEAREQ